MGLRQRALQGMRIQFYLKAANVVLSQLGAVILAVVLVPRDFALYGLAMIFVGYGNTISEIGIGSTLIQRNPDYSRALETGTTLRLISAALVTGTLVLVAPLIAAAYSEPGLEWVILALSTLVLLNFASFVPRVHLTRDLDFRRVFIPEAIAGACTVLSSVGLALAGLSFWSLVVGSIIGSAVYAGGLFLIHPWKATWRLQRRLAAELLAFGGTLTAGEILFLVFTSIGVILLGMMRFQEVGYFLLASSWTISIAMSLFNALDNVSFPVFSAMKSEAARVRRAYMTLMQYLAWTVIPLGLLAVSAAPVFVLAVLGSKWAGSIPLIQILGVSGILLVLSLPYRSVVIAVGRPREVLSYDVIAASVMTIVALLLVTLMGAIGLAATFLLVSVVLLTWAVVRLGRVLGPIASELGRLVAPPVIASLCFAVPFSFLELDLTPSLPLFVLEVIGSVAIYLAVLVVVTRGQALAELKDLSRAFIRK